MVDGFVWGLRIRGGLMKRIGIFGGDFEGGMVLIVV